MADRRDALAIDRFPQAKEWEAWDAGMARMRRRSLGPVPGIPASQDSHTRARVVGSHGRAGRVYRCCSTLATEMTVSANTHKRAAKNVTRARAKE